MTHVGMNASEKQNCEPTLEPKLFATDFGRAAVRIRRSAHIGLLMDGFWTAFGRLMIRRLAHIDNDDDDYDDDNCMTPKEC